MSKPSSDGILREVLRQVLREPLNAGEAPWTQEQWCEAFSFLFLASPDSRHTLLEHQDDMLWFVTAPAALGPGMSPVSLRRNTAAGLPPELHPGGSGFATVAWDSTLQLNLAIHAKYVLTVVQCRAEALVAVAQGHAIPGGHLAPGPSQNRHPQAVVAQRRVFASPMAADVNLENAKSGRPPQPCYPDVCFAVDNFEDAFQDMILSQPGDCYCVMLHVHASKPTAAQDPAITTTAGTPQASQTRPPQPYNSSQTADERRATLFSAYVTREQVAAYLASRAAEGSRPSLLNRLLGGPRRSDAEAGLGLGQQERVVMSGPGGVGRAEALAAAAAAKDAGSGAGAGAGTGRVGSGQLQLSLMWMSLPLGALARAVLQFACEGL